jgi:hypothetical protein
MSRIHQKRVELDFPPSDYALDNKDKASISLEAPTEYGNKDTILNSTYTPQHVQSITSHATDRDTAPLKHSTVQFLEQLNNFKKLVEPILDKIMQRQGNVTAENALERNSYIGFLDDGIPIRNRIVGEDREVQIPWITDENLEEVTTIETSTIILTETLTQPVTETVFLTETLTDPGPTAATVILTELATLTAIVTEQVTNTATELETVTESNEATTVSVTETIAEQTTATLIQTLTEKRTESLTITRLSLVTQTQTITILPLSNETPNLGLTDSLHTTHPTTPVTLTQSQTVTSVQTITQIIAAETHFIEIPLEVKAPVEISTLPLYISAINTTTQFTTETATQISIRCTTTTVTIREVIAELARPKQTTSAPQHSAAFLSRSTGQGPFPSEILANSTHDRSPQFTDMVLEVETVYVDRNKAAMLQSRMTLLFISLLAVIGTF